MTSSKKPEIQNTILLCPAIFAAGAGKNQQKVNTVRRVLLKEPPPAKMGADVTGDGAKGDWLETTVGYVGGFSSLSSHQGCDVPRKNRLADVPGACSHVHIHRDPFRRTIRCPQTVIAAVFHKRHIQP